MNKSAAKKNILRPIGLSMVIAATTFVVFRDTFALPYIGDDWHLLHECAFKSTRQLFLHAFDVTIQQFRPLQWIYTWVVYKIWGPYSSGWHWPAMIAHCLTALLLVYIMRRILQSELMAWMVGFLYAIAIHIHIVQQLWMVGSCDVFGALFVFASIVLLMNRRHVLSAVCFLIALLFKEATITMLGVIAGYILYERKLSGKSSSWLVAVARRLYWHGLAAVLFLIPKSMTHYSPLTLPDNAPYKLAFTGLHVIRNGLVYALWTAQTVFSINILHPKKLARFLISGDAVSIAIIVGIAVAFIALLAAVYRRRKAANPIWQWDDGVLYGLLIAWVIFGLAPVYFLKNHLIAYYLTYSLPACLALILLMLRSFAHWMSISRKTIVILAIVFLAGQFLLSVGYTNRVRNEGHFMFKAASQIEAVHSFLMNNYPKIPRNTVLIMEGDNILFPLRNYRAIQLWYRDQSIRVFNSRFIECDKSGLFAVRPPLHTEFPGSELKSDRVRLDPKHIMWIRVSKEFKVSICGMPGD